MEFKVNSPQDDRNFLFTKSYKTLYKRFKILKKKKGQIIHVLGAPGTGKSTNIYQAFNNLNLNVYNVKLVLSNDDLSSKYVFNVIFDLLKDDLKVKSKNDIYQGLSKFDAVLIADAFHDTHLLHKEGTGSKELVGFSKWSEHVGIRALNFYLRCILEYIKYRKIFKKINLVFQTSWRIYIRGKKYDLFSDLGILSRALVFLLKQIFTVVEIKYSEDETLKIVKNHLPEAPDELIHIYIKKYGFKPRLICNAIQKNDNKKMIIHGKKNLN